MEHRTPEPVQASNDKLVAISVGRGKGLIELGPAGFGAAGIVDVDIVRGDLRTHEGVYLMVRVLVCGGNSGFQKSCSLTITGGGALPLRDTFGSVGIYRPGWQVPVGVAAEYGKKSYAKGELSQVATGLQLANGSPRASP